MLSMIETRVVIGACCHPSPLIQVSMSVQDLWILPMALAVVAVEERLCQL
jgi:hypothetical protein